MGSPLLRRRWEWTLRASCDSSADVPSRLPPIESSQLLGEVNPIIPPSANEDPADLEGPVVCPG